MKVTHFFIIMLGFSLSLFIFLRPEQLAKPSGEVLPQLEIEDFTLYEMDETGVTSVVSGSDAKQYVSHYEVENAHYIENKNKLGEHLYADHARFEKDIAYLNDNVRYFREDGLSFESDKAIYNTNKENLYVPGSFVLTQNENVVYGKELYYNSITGKMKANEIDANYYIIEDKK
jgi:LPS export ABC transporter protein LptC